MPSAYYIGLYKQLFINLLLRGRIWQILSAQFQLFWESFAVELVRQREAFDSLSQQANPLTATDPGLLPEQEASALLPNEMPVPGETVQQRQQAVAAKKQLALPGPSRAFFLSLASTFGISITITEGTTLHAGIGNRINDQFTLQQGKAVWTLTIMSDPFGNTTKFQQRVQNLNPAHLQVVFA